MPGKPLVSIVIPSYNHGNFLHDTIGSVEAQTYRPLELVVVDDGSTDESPETLRQLASQTTLDRFELIEQANAGAHAAIMRGIESSHGEIVGILNSDDFYDPRRVEALIPHLHSADHPRGHDLVFSGVRFVDEKSRELDYDHAWPTWYREGLYETRHTPTRSFALLAHNFSVSSGNFLFRRSLYEKLEGFSEHRFTHDWDFLIRSFHYTEPAFVPEPLLSYRIHETNTTETVRDLLREEASDALERYIALVTSERTPNPLAPCPANWPDYFSRFARRTKLAFAPDLTLEEFWSQRTAARLEEQLA